MLGKQCHHHRIGLGRLFTMVYKRRIVPSFDSTTEQNRGYTCSIA